ncbi:collagen alpha-1(III) chain-like, partial [Pristis pectinata]|uniref:collagen alpha-1(III) chain-like n=1 Tax=Pristis pectinata TaxID=685728 RepID=UPI00223E0B13
NDQRRPSEALTPSSMAAKRKCDTLRSAAPGEGQGAAGEAEEEAWTGSRAAEVVVYDRERDRERALGGGQREEEDDEEEEEEEEGPEGYHCQICGYHADQLQPFNVHLHTAHPAVVLRELYGLLGLPGCPGPGLFGVPIPGLGVTLGPGPSPVGGPVPGLGLTRGPSPSGSPFPGLSLTGGPVPALTGGPIPGGGPVPALTGGPSPSGEPIPCLGMTGGPSASGGPIPGLGLTGGPKPGLSRRPHPSPGEGPVPGLSLTRGPHPEHIDGSHPVPSRKPGMRLTGGPIPGLGLTGDPHPEHTNGLHRIPGGGPVPDGGPIPGLGLSRGPTPLPGRTAGPLPGRPSHPRPAAERDVVQIDLTGEDEAGRPSPEPPAVPTPSPPSDPRPQPLDPELEAGGPLAESFSRFPYPSPAELARCGLSAGLPAERVRVWFAVQRLRHGISWTPEEVREARDKLRRGAGPLRLPLPPGTGPSPGPQEGRAPRCRKTKGQLAALKSSFSRGPYPDQAETRRLQARTGLGRAEIRRWFSDSRYQRRRGPAGPLCRREGEEEEEGGATGTPGTACRRPRAPSLGRPRKSKEQLAVLKGFFLRSRWPSGEDYGRLVQSTGLARADIIQWFGDTRYALKNGQLKWVHRGSAGLATGGGEGGRRRRRLRPGVEGASAEGQRPREGGEEVVVVGNGTSGHSSPAVGLAL